MDSRISIRTMSRLLATSAGIGVLGTLLAAQANAGCSYQPPTQAPSQQMEPRIGAGRLIATAFTQNSGWPGGGGEIVGLWKFTFTAEGNTGPGAPPNGAPIDAGYVTWHSDGTELMNSGRAPTTGNFCMGVWEQTGPSTFTLNHFPLAWEFDADTPATAPGTGGADYVGPANIREVVTVSRDGMSYQGHFTLIQYAADEKTVLADIAGVVKATRVTVNSGVAD